MTLVLPLTYCHISWVIRHWSDMLGIGSKNDVMSFIKVEEAGMDFRQRREAILNDNITKVIITLAIPVIINNLIQTFYNLTDTYFVAQIGGNEVASIQLVWPILFLMISFGTGMSAAGTTLIAQYIGNKNELAGRKIAGQMVSFLVLLAIVIGVLGAFFAPHVVYAMGARETLYSNAVTYLRIMFLGLPTMFLMFAYNAVKQGQGDNVSPMYFGAISVVINIILDPIFIFVLGQGIAGAAYATIIARGVVGLYSVMTLFTRSQTLILEPRALGLEKTSVFKICQLGIPSSLGQAMTAFGFIILNVFLVGFGEVTLTAFAIGNRISSLILMPVMGIGSALGTVVGQNLGADNLTRAKQAVKHSAVFSTVVLLVGGGLMYPFIGRLIGVFSKDSEVIFHGSNYLRLIILGIPLMGFFQIFIGTFQGSGHTIYSMILMMGRLWGIRLPVVFLLSHRASFGPTSVWYAMVFSNFIICIVGLIMYLSGGWQHKVIKDKAVILE